MSVRNDDNIIKSLVILAVCIVAMLMVCTECALLPQYGWLWLILAIAAVFSVVMGIKTWLDEHGRKLGSIMEEHAGKLWFGICAGRTVPSARLALAGTRITALDKTDTVMECFMDPSVAKNPDPVWAACHAMDMTLTGPRIPEDVVPSLPQAIWVEFMGIDEKPDSDDYEIAVDLVAGDFYYSPNLKDDGNRKGFALCVQHLTDYIASQMDEKKSHD